ncbi:MULTISPECIES: virB8 family protein [Sphingopyxis]|jgi:type IV secretion system protein VirB8|uniref:virB8 family protein n=1 Tax=Sphingopyxis TaxID=165697 RepID=UPI001660C056|nr:VirB8/TrbF family protein [Sphingopyxis sp. LK2115]
MKQTSREALDAYYAEADSWANDRNDALRSSRRTAWWVAGAASVIAVCEALALLFLTPLKTVEPYTLLVDRQTGFVQQLKPLEAQTISPTHALTQSFLVQYVIAREGFDIDLLQNDYRKVALWSAGAARDDYLSEIQVSNPESPLVRLPRSSLIDVEVKSVTPLGGDTAMIRFDTRRRDANGHIYPAQPWVVVVRYSYSGEPMSAADRMVNPLGFKVSSYRKSAEALPAPEPAAVATSSAAVDPRTAGAAPQQVPSHP